MGKQGLWVGVGVLYTILSPLFSIVVICPIFLRHVLHLNALGH